MEVGEEDEDGTRLTRPEVPTLLPVGSVRRSWSPPSNQFELRTETRETPSSSTITPRSRTSGSQTLGVPGGKGEDEVAGTWTVPHPGFGRKSGESTRRQSVLRLVLPLTDLSTRACGFWEGAVRPLVPSVVSEGPGTVS